MWQLICGNGIAKILGRNLIVILAMKLPKIGENCLDKKNILNSYSKKYTYFYSFRVSVVFLIEAIWFMCMSCSFISYCKSILCMICPMKQIINLDSSTLILILKKKKKKNNYIDFYNTKWKKKMIDVHTVKKKKEKKEKKKKLRFFTEILCNEYMFIVK